jgi:hypothetical protein
VTDRNITPDHMIAYLAPRVQGFKDMGLAFGEVRFSCPEEGTDKAQIAFALFLTVLEQLGCLPCAIINEPAPAVARAIVTSLEPEKLEEKMTRYKVIFKIVSEPDVPAPAASLDS